jgi:hypothetical protein
MSNTPALFYYLHTYYAYGIGHNACRMCNCKTQRQTVIMRYLSICLSVSLPWALAAFSVSWSSTQSVGHIGRVIRSSQGRFLRTEQQKHRIYAHSHPCLTRDSNPRSQCLSGRRQFMPLTVWRLGSMRVLSSGHKSSGSIMKQAGTCLLQFTLCSAFPFTVICEREMQSLNTTGISQHIKLGIEIEPEVLLRSYTDTNKVTQRYVSRNGR